MFKSKRLKRQLRKVNELKLKEIKNENFDLAANLRDEEKKILQELTRLKSENSLYKLRKFIFYKFSSECLQGLYLQEKESDLPIYLPFYYFSRELNHYLECFFAEHPAFRFDWNEQPSKRRNMIKEVTEYYFITEILDHFNRGCLHDKGNCNYELKRDDLMAINESNLFLKLFTLPLKNRTAFKRYEKEIDRNIIVAKDENKNLIGYYHRFHYKFPYKIKLKRNNEYFVIITPFMRLKFHINCCGEVRLPKDFCNLVYGFKKEKAPRIDVFINVSIKRFAYIHPRYRKHIRNIPELKRRLKESFSSDKYFNIFSWQNIYLQSMILKNQLINKTL